jgi:hypothetical protein
MRHFFQVLLLLGSPGPITKQNSTHYETLQKIKLMMTCSQNLIYQKKKKHDRKHKTTPIRTIHLRIVSSKKKHYQNKRPLIYWSRASCETL